MQKAVLCTWHLITHSILTTVLDKYYSVQFSSVAQSCPTLFDPMNCSTPGLPVHHQLPEFTQTPGVYSNSCPLSRWCHPTISSSVIPFSSCLQSFTASGCFPMSQFFASGGQSIGASTSASVLPMNPSIERLYQWVSSVVSLTYNNKTLQHILVFHGCRTNYHTFCGLKQDRVIIS